MTLVLRSQRQKTRTQPPTDALSEIQLQHTVGIRQKSQYFKEISFTAIARLLDMKVLTRKAGKKKPTLLGGRLALLAGCHGGLRGVGKISHRPAL